MANRWAVGNGNYNTAATWNDPGGGATVPSSTDDVYANNYTVQLDVDVVANTIRTTAAAGIAAGGLFSYSGAANRSITATNGFYGTSNAVGVLSINVASPVVVTIIGNIVPTGRVFIFAGTGTINYTGDIPNYAGGYNGGVIYSTSAGTVNTTGSFGCGSYFSAGVNYNNWAYYHNGVGTWNHTGNLTGNSAGYCAVNASTGSINVIGIVTSGAVITGYGIYSTTAGYVTVIGIIDIQTPPAITSPAVYLTTGTLYFSGIIKNRSSSMAINVNKMVLLSAGSTTWEMIDDTASTKPLYSTDNVMNPFGYPAESDTRKDVIYGQSNEFKGSCNVPTPATTLLDVPVDATVGTLLMTPADFINELNTSVVDVAVRLRNCSTPETTGDQIAALVT